MPKFDFYVQMGWHCCRMWVAVFPHFTMASKTYAVMWPEEEINETVKAGRIQRTDKCKYLGMTISTDGHLTKHTKRTKH